MKLAQLKRRRAAAISLNEDTGNQFSIAIRRKTTWSARRASGPKGASAPLLLDTPTCYIKAKGND